jgi:predicted Zn-dependent peptidase
MTTPENALKARAELLKEPSLWVKPGYFSDSQLEDVRRKLKINYKMELNKPSAYAKTLAFWWAITGLDYYDTYLRSMEKVSIKDVQNVVRKYLIDKPHVSMTLLNPKDADKSKITDNSAPFVDKYLKNY